MTNAINPTDLRVIVSHRLESTRNFQGGESLVAVHGFLILGASLVVGGWAAGVAACWLSSPVACGIFPDPGLNPRPLRWQVDFQSQDHQGSPWDLFKMRILTLYLRPTESETPGMELQVWVNSLQVAPLPRGAGAGVLAPQDWFLHLPSLWCPRI